MISVGDKGRLVSLVQEALARQNLYAGRIDGVFGPKTEAAVKQWQTKHVTGVLDESDVRDLLRFPADLPELAQRNNDLALVHPVVAAHATAVVEGCARHGVAVGIFEGYRSPTRQAALYALGRTAPGPAVTNAGPLESYHNFGLAVDLVVDGDPVKPGFQWDWSNRRREYETIGAVAEEHGCEWAGRWKRFPEKPHIQLTFGFQLHELREMLAYHGELPGVWEEMAAASPVTQAH